MVPWMGRELNSFKDASEEHDWILFKEFPVAKTLIQEKLKVDLADVKGSVITPEKQKEIYKAAYNRIGWEAKIDQEVAYLTNREGMVKFLLPINVALLEPPVAQLYNKAFAKAWEKLETRGRPVVRRQADRGRQEAGNRVTEGGSHVDPMDMSVARSPWGTAG